MQKPLKPCNKHGCPNLTRESYCEQHKSIPHKRYDDKRGSSSQRGYNSKWRKARLSFLQNNPLCVQCNAEGRLTVANIDDHIQPHKGDMKLFWDSTNWQPLCKHHHDVKTATEDGGFGK